MEDPIHPPPLSRSGSTPKPKGILKNAPHPPASPQQGPRLQWDEENLAATEIQKDSLMKITEPKTPFVRYNAETDTIEGDIPSLDLYAGQRASPAPLAQSPTNADSSGPSSRRTSFSSTGGRPSLSGRSGSATSSRSTSFSLPNDARREIRSVEGDRGGEVEEEEMDEETAAKHEAFVKARGRHYSNEAQAMKLAAKLMEEEDDDDAAETDSRADTASEDVSMEDSAADEVSPRVNGRS
ncbi:hypothetical protein GLOTRDRAFT_109575 [Gloeophyllum trabeum ATCC 11539]|uniref:Protein phosphatase inhibitor 2 n=1 Tax=Gloeophyllum trabeum (strain ATCC 11539 / FP-39264 / Madison 617) TaxID=670483 RepID=S7QIP3_GLOTA|nr:uncharacterized protein GLOTRDRAFT_109575 [Gloeophyllum trabeum ATCC 11539]EPQ59192.1 hypothetical protein GLOTRDRAFT_109575 [Gloeophyllum trabeum ATCC 11539]